MSATAGSFSQPNYETEDFGIKGAFEIIGMVAAFMFGIVLIKWIHITVLRDFDSLKRTLGPALRFILPWWNPRTQADGNTTTASQENDEIELVSSTSLLRDMTREQKSNILSSIVRSETATKEDLGGRKKDTGNVQIPDGSELLNEEDAMSSDILTCVICFSEVSIGQRVTQTSCNHMFHFDCLCEWIITDKTDCPHCRNEIVTKEMLEHG
jgi:hypothetical protein